MSRAIVCLGERRSVPGSRDRDPEHLAGALGLRRIRYRDAAGVHAARISDSVAAAAARISGEWPSGRVERDPRLGHPRERAIAMGGAPPAVLAAAGAWAADPLPVVGDLLVYGGRGRMVRRAVA